MKTTIKYDMKRNQQKMYPKKKAFIYLNDKKENTTVVRDIFTTSNQTAEDLLTPENILNCYVVRKEGDKTVLNIEKTLPNIEKWDDVSKVERFAGLSNSPSADELPLPTFSFVDQELSNEKGKSVEFKTVSSIEQAFFTPQPARPNKTNDFYPQKSNTPQPAKSKNGRFRKQSSPNRQKPSSPTSQIPNVNSKNMPVERNNTAAIQIPNQPVRSVNINHSPTSNPHLDELSCQLRMMLNITPVQ